MKISSADAPLKAPDLPILRVFFILPELPTRFLRVALRLFSETDAPRQKNNKKTTNNETNAFLFADRNFRLAALRLRASFLVDFASRRGFRPSLFAPQAFGRRPFLRDDRRARRFYRPRRRAENRRVGRLPDPRIRRLSDAGDSDFNAFDDLAGEAALELPRRLDSRNRFCRRVLRNLRRSPILRRRVLAGRSRRDVGRDPY